MKRQRVEPRMEPPAVWDGPGHPITIHPEPLAPSLLEKSCDEVANNGQFQSLKGPDCTCTRNRINLDTSDSVQC